MMNIAKYLLLVRCTQHRPKNVSVSQNETGRNIANKLITTRLPGIPVVDSQNKKVVGIVTEFDILSALRKGLDLDEFTAERIMSTAPATADIDTPVNDLIEMMIKNNSTMVPITKNNKLAGIIDRCSIMEGYMAPGADRYLAKQI